MTCIVGLVHKGTVYMGGDSAMTSGWDLDNSAQPKVFRNGEYLIGFTASFRIGQILEHHFEPSYPPSTAGRATTAFMVTTFIDELREVLRHAGFSKEDSGQEQSGGEFLVGIRGRLFHVNDDYSVTESVHGFNACGAGDSAALGAMFATKGRSKSFTPTRRICLALAAAEALNASVRRPFTVLSTP